VLNLSLRPIAENLIDARFRLELALRDLKQRDYTLAIIDTPGSDSDVVTEAIRLADLCLIPARPSQADIEAACPTLKAIRKFDRKFAFVLNPTSTRAATALNEVGMLALPYVGMRNDHMDSLATGLGIMNSHLTVLRQPKSELSGFG
jgi:chromosome partitioning protein